MAVLHDLQAVGSAISAKYEAPVSINLANGGQLTITFQNSKYASLAPTAREAFARDVARFAVARFAGRDNLRVVRVGFQSVKGVPGFTVSRSEAPYSWPASELLALPDSAAMAAAKVSEDTVGRTKR